MTVHRCAFCAGKVSNPARGRQVTVTTTESQPVAPLGKTPVRLPVCVAPVPSVARTYS